MSGLIHPLIVIAVAAAIVLTYYRIKKDRRR